MKTLEGRVTIARVQSTAKNHVIIEIRDRTSGVTFVKVRMNFEAFGNAITGLAEQDAILECYGLDIVGKKRVIKEERIPMTVEFKKAGYSNRKEAGRKLAKPYEVDGWMCDMYDFNAGSKWNEDDTITVRFVRYEDIIEEDG